MLVTFSLAGPADLDSLMGFLREFYALEHLAFDETRSRETLEVLLGDPTLGLAWVIQTEGTAAGYVVLTFAYSLEYQGRAACLDEIYLRPERRGQGVGTEVLRFVEGYCRAHGIRSLHLEVERPNTAAQRLYRRAGFASPDRVAMKKWVT